MTVKGKKTPGFRIGKIRLFESSFSLDPSSVDADRSSEEKRGDIRMEKLLIDAVAEKPNSFTCRLIVRVAGTAKETTEWKACIVYSGEFFHSAEKSKIMRKTAIHVYAPSYLFAYAREQLSDLLRRAGYGVNNFSPLPPMDFISGVKEEEAEGRESSGNAE